MILIFFRLSEEIAERVHSSRMDSFYLKFSNLQIQRTVSVEFNASEPEGHQVAHSHTRERSQEQRCS